MKKSARLLAPLVLAGFAIPAGAAGITVPGVHRSPAASRRLAVTPQVASAVGVGLNLDVVGRITASGTTFKTSVDISNNTSTDTQVDVYFSGNDLTHGTAIDIGPVSVTAAGLVSQGAAELAHLSVFHSDDLIDDFRQAGLITQTEEDDGILGSLFVIYNSPSAGLFDQIGQGSVQARFYSANADGTIGVSANGHELTESEPTSLVGIVRNTVGEAGTPQLYTNFFINNEGYADTSGNIVANDIQVKLTAYSNSTGAKVGQSAAIPIGAFQTVGYPNVWQQLHGSSNDDTLIVFVDIVSG
ncbi:MAG TPA: hypothetical protein VFL12_10185, partial [Thermoanaerobaculia bacterium]|nr:hypothetical protein [Thermoanaerobaculia bacterium]